MRIFVAEDSPLVRERLVQMIEEIDGMTVVGQTGNARLACEQIAELQPEVAVLDVHLVDGDAFTVLAGIRQQAPATQVILVSAMSFAGYRAKAKNCGARFYFDKSKELQCIAPALRQLAGEAA
jgi:DNA-binding NarL/FixJ family response regulator